MLIGIDASRALRARRTGTENYSLQLIRQLLALDSGHRFRLYCDQPLPAELQDIGTAGKAEICVIPFPRLWTHLRLSAEVMGNPPDVLFVPSHVLPIVHPRRSVVTVHDLGYSAFPKAHRRFNRWYLQAGTRFSARTAGHVLADSQATKDDLVRLCGLDPARVTVAYLGRDAALAPVTDSARLTQVQERLGIARSGSLRPYVLTVGTLQPRKNLVRLIDAFARIRPTQPDLCLVLAGQRGWLSDPIFQRVEELGLQESVLFPGFVSDDDLPALLSGALVFAFPSLYEGFGFPVLEAQACGTPVLTSTTSSLPEVAGEAALLVDPMSTEAIADGLHQLVTDSSLRKRLRAAGFANIQRFSWQRCAVETLQVLEHTAHGDL
jgi:glycosyltransferase involved in cell wall biosynthesis